MRIREILLEKKKKQIITMYHGTSTLHVRSILKQGLIVDPKYRNYDSEQNDWTDPADDTYSGGVYLTQSVSVAEDYAEMVADTLGGEPVIVEIQMVLGSEEVDEDIIWNAADESFDQAIKIIQQDARSMKLKDFVVAIQNSNLLNQIKQSFIADFSNNNDFRRVSDKAKSQTLGQLFDYTINKLIKISQNQKHAEDSVWITTRSMRGETRKDSAYENLIRDLMRQTSVNIQQTHGEATARIPRNIGFRGKTKIVSITGMYSGEVYYRYQKPRRKRTRR
jgi:hypothetical protein